MVSDGHKGIQKAVEESFLGASWQMCHVSLLRVAQKNVAKKYHKEIAGKFKAGLEDENKMQELIPELESRGYSKSVDTIERFSSAYGTTGRFLFLTRGGSEQQLDWGD